MLIAAATLRMLCFSLTPSLQNHEELEIDIVNYYFPYTISHLPPFKQQFQNSHLLETSAI
jgi:hypothetical protein